MTYFTIQIGHEWTSWCSSRADNIGRVPDGSGECEEEVRVGTGQSHRHV